MPIVCNLASGAAGVWGELRQVSSPYRFPLYLLSRCLIPEGTIPQSGAAEAATTNTIGAGSISAEEVAPGQVAVTGPGGAGGRTVTMFVPEGEASGRDRLHMLRWR